MWPWCCGELGGDVEMMEEGCEVVALVLWRAGWCCGELGGAVEVKKEGREVVAPDAVESWVVLWR